MAGNPGLKTAVFIEGTLNDLTVRITAGRSNSRSVGGAGRSGAPALPAGSWRAAEGQLFARGVATSRSSKAITGKLGTEGRQLGLVAAGRDRYAPSGKLGLCAVLDGSGGNDFLRPRPGLACAAAVDAQLLSSARLSQRARASCDTLVRTGRRLAERKRRPLEPGDNLHRICSDRDSDVAGRFPGALAGSAGICGSGQSENNSAEGDGMSGGNERRSRERPRSGGERF